MITVMEPVSKMSKMSMHMRVQCDKVRACPLRPGWPGPRALPPFPPQHPAPRGNYAARPYPDLEFARATFAQCDGEGMIDRNKLKRQQQAKRREEELRQAIAAKEAQVATTPVSRLEVEKDIRVVQIETPAGTEAVAETAASRVVIQVELPELHSVGDIDAEVVDRTRFELEVVGLYWLEVALPYGVDDEEMTCQFNKDQKILTVTLPILQDYVAAPQVSLDLQQDGTISCDITI